MPGGKQLALLRRADRYAWRCHWPRAQPRRWCCRFQDDANLYFVLELARGGDLFAVQSAQPNYMLPEPWAPRRVTCRTLCRATAEAPIAAGLVRLPPVRLCPDGESGLG